MMIIISLFIHFSVSHMWALSPSCPHRYLNTKASVKKQFDCTFGVVTVGKAQVLTLTETLFYSSVPVSHDNGTASQHAQYQDPETEAAKWNSAIIHFIIYTCAFLTVTCQNVSYKKTFSFLSFLMDGQMVTFRIKTKQIQMKLIRPMVFMVAM